MSEGSQFPEDEYGGCYRTTGLLATEPTDAASIRKKVLFKLRLQNRAFPTPSVTELKQIPK